MLSKQVKPRRHQSFFGVIVLYCFFTFACIGQVHAFIFGPKNYDDCILQNMKNVTSDQAARSIEEVCYKKFPEKRPKPTGITNCQVHYTGSRFEKGNFPEPLYITYRADRYGTQVVSFSVPAKMANTKDFDGDKFFRNNYNLIAPLCGF